MLAEADVGEGVEAHPARVVVVTRNSHGCRGRMLEWRGTRERERRVVVAAVQHRDAVRSAARGRQLDVLIKKQAPTDFFASHSCFGLPAPTFLEVLALAIYCIDPHDYAYILPALAVAFYTIRVVS